MPALTITSFQSSSPFSERSGIYQPKRTNEIYIYGYLLCNPQKSNLPAVSLQRRGWPEKEVSRRKSKGIILMIKATK